GLPDVRDAGVDRGPVGFRAGAEAALDATPGAGLGHAVAGRGTGVAATDRPAEQVRVEPLRPAGVGAEHLEPVDRLTAPLRRAWRLVLCRVRRLDQPDQQAVRVVEHGNGHRAAEVGDRHGRLRAQRFGLVQHRLEVVGLDVEGGPGLTRLALADAAVDSPAAVGVY